jgi:alkylated DNA repair dioxygenase AlkB
MHFLTNFQKRISLFPQLVLSFVVAQTFLNHAMCFTLVIHSPLKYATITRNPLSWPTPLLLMRSRIQAVVDEVLSHLPCQPSNSGLNALLLNRYKNGQDKMGKHRDLTPCLGVDPFIASVSLGATREFRFRKFTLAQEREQKDHTKRNCGKGRQQGATLKTTYKSLQLTHGSLLVMIGGLLQENYQHEVIKDAQVSEPRWNLNFRHHYCIDGNK